MTALEPTLSKIPDQWKPRRRRSLTLAPPKKSFVCDFDFARDQFFLLKGKQNFSLVSCSERAGGGCGFCFMLGRGGIPPTPLPLRPRLGWRFFGGQKY